LPIEHREEHISISSEEQVGTVEEHEVAPQHEYLPAGHAEQVPSRRFADQLEEHIAAFDE